MNPDTFAHTPEPPYFAVIFTSHHSGSDMKTYGTTSARMLKLAAMQDGFLGVESCRDTEGTGITVSYWRDEAAIQQWYRNLEHQHVQQKGRDRWYSAFQVRVARVERAYEFVQSDET